jgi:hypothetical protein
MFEIIIDEIGLKPFHPYNIISPIWKKGNKEHFNL